MSFMEFLKKMFGKKEECGCGCHHEQSNSQNQQSTQGQPEQQAHTEQNQ